MALIASAALCVAVPSVALGSAGSFTWASQSGGATAATAPGGTAVFPDGTSISVGDFGGGNSLATFGSTTLTATGTKDVYVTKANADGTVAWASQVVGAAGKSDYGQDVAALPDGGAIITGAFQGTATFGSLPSITAASPNYWDLYVAKVNANGQFVWATRAGSSSASSWTHGYGVSTLPDGSSIVTGFFTGTVAFGSTTLTAGGVQNAFVAKLNADGTFAWATKAGQTSGVGNPVAYGVSTLPDGSSIVTGVFEGTAVFGSISLTSLGGNDAFVAKVTADGTFAWATRAGGSGTDQGYGGVSALPDGSSVIGGRFSDTASFGSTTLTSAGGLDIFVAKVNPDGTFAWAKQAGGTGTDFAEGVSIRSDGSSIVTGQFAGTATFGTTSLTTTAASAPFVTGFAADGAFSWTITPTGTALGAGYGISALNDGRSVFAGSIASGSATYGSTALSRSSSATDAVAAGLLSPPVAPSAPTATAGAGEASVTISPVSGSAITSYKVEATSGSHTCTVTLPATKCSVTGLTGGTSYTFTARAVNAAGEGAASPASNAVTPTAASTKALTATVLPQSTRLVSGQQMRVGIRVKHGGTTAASSVVSCMKLPANLVVIKKGSARRSGSTLCFTTKSLAAGKQVTNTVTVRAVSTRKVVRTITGSARAAGITKVTAAPKKVTITPRAARARVTG